MTANISSPSASTEPPSAAGRRVPSSAIASAAVAAARATVIAGDGPRQPPHRSLLSHSDTWAGCTVSRDHAAQVRAERLEVELVAQPRRRTPPACAPRRSGGGRSAGRPRAWMRARAGRNSAATASVETAIARFEVPERQPDQQHERQVGRAQRGRQRAVDQRAVDDDVDVEQPVAQDRRAGGHREDREGERQHGVAHRLEARVLDEVADDVGDDRRAGDRRREREPLELLALDAARASQPQRHRHGGEADGQPHEQPAQPGQRVERLLGAGDPERVVDDVERRVERARAQAVSDHDEGDPGQRHHQAPAASVATAAAHRGTAAARARAARRRAGYRAAARPRRWRPASAARRRRARGRRTGRRGCRRRGSAP